MKDLNALAIFAKVVETGSYSRAAGALGLSKSAVSKQVSRLEDRLGARLLNRTTRRLALTEVGAVFYERCAHVVAEAEEAELAVTHLSTVPRGTLRVSAPATFGTMYLAPILPAFLGRCSEMRIELALNDRVTDLVDEGLDMALRIGHLRDSSLIARRIGTTRRVTCAAPAYWQRRGRPRTPADLAGHACLRYSMISIGEEWRYTVGGRREGVQVHGPLVTNNGEVLLHAALGGLGVVALPAFIAGPALADGRLEAVLESFEEEPLPIHCVYPHARHVSPKVRVFVDFLVDRFGDEAEWCRRADHVA